MSMSLVGRVPLPSLATRRRVAQLAARALLSTISGSASAAAAASVSAAALAPDERQHHPHLLRHHTGVREEEDAPQRAEAAAINAADENKRKDQQVLAQEFAKPQADVTFLVNNYTAPALAAAYQDRYARCCCRWVN
jgi:histidine ammonia-lyase